MLNRITIKDLVIVHHLDLPLRPGMTTLTGETGAGKSILIDGLSLALGGKASDGMIRAGAATAEVTLGFELEADSAARHWLDAHDLGANGDCLLRRVLVRDGRGRAYINGTPSPQRLLRELGELLIDIHGQHAHQSLLRGAAQRRLLDAYAGLRPLARQVGQLFQTWQQSRNAHASLKQASDDRANRLDYLGFQISELSDVVIPTEQLTAIESEHDRLAHAERLSQDVGGLLASLDDADRSPCQALEHAARLLSDLSTLDTNLKETQQLIDTAGIQLSEALSNLRRYRDCLEQDPQRLAHIDDRLSRIHDAARKHRVTASELPELLVQLQTEVAALENAGEDLLHLEQQIQTQAAAYHEAARELSQKRHQAAAQLADIVTASMQQLGMAGGAFRIACDTDPDEPTGHGVDKVAYRVAANPGQPEAALAEVASGGELSRISLAVQVATADCGAVPTLVFDEVDVGIGGAIAEIVGQLLRRLGRERQVLCVTHLAQVAVQADQQLRVHKVSDDQTTQTRIDALDKRARVDEIARMLGGVDITQQTRKHASEMMCRAKGQANL